VTLVSRREMADLKRIQNMTSVRMREWNSHPSFDRDHHAGSGWKPNVE
jgi:hypothetical protein